MYTHAEAQMCTDAHTDTQVHSHLCSFYSSTVKSKYYSLHDSNIEEKEVFFGGKFLFNSWQLRSYILFKIPHCAVNFLHAQQNHVHDGNISNSWKNSPKISMQ